MPVRFCRSCYNLLYPRTAKGGHRKLYYGCRNCEYEEEAGEDRMVYANELLSVVTEKSGVTEDVEMDPTLPRSNMECPTCHAKECVYFQDQSKRKVTNMRLFYKCVSCKSVFTDPRADDGPQKDRERSEREARLNAEKTKKKKAEEEVVVAPVAAAPSKTTGMDGGAAVGGAGARRVQQVQEDDASDGEY